eukprot:CAMPEP_0119042240 /NCGR_PEP_ID=MMETSP1177-20130426/14477_1 /TAXON_ID=2985 /ORGANISM="Ochromonas sp, Strain CCMP1899" /LENGTH=89 /DNA_ID=CAMNT_0007008879 /DNA_START=149 /DNA_END=418 /DNA_ORIENTATION=+
MARSSKFSTQSTGSSNTKIEFLKIPLQLYQNVWKKSNILYITYIVVGCVVIEVVYGGITSSIWDTYNQGKLYKQIDWTKFKSEDDEDEE